MDNTLSNSTQAEPAEQQQKSFVRFDLLQRIEHVVMLTSFTLLAITGLPQKFPESPLSVSIIRAFGGVESARQIHHLCAVVLMGISIVHVLDVLYRIIVMRRPLGMVPLFSDFVHLYQDVLYYLGLRKHKAYYGRYSYVEKAEYLALVWGTILMGVTGFMMWNPIATARWLPGEVIPAAKYAHGGEAILAVLAIFIWHFYHVHLRHFNKSMFTGKMTREEMEHEHPAELASIEEGTGWQRPVAGELRRRQRIFFPVALVLTGVMSYGIIWFVTQENTAPITTIPKGETVEIFVPLTPTPRPTPIPSPTPELAAGVSPNSWEGQFSALFRNRCSSCHGLTAVGGLSLATYEQALEGGDNGPAVVPGDPDASLLVQVQAPGDHPGQLTIDELNAVIEWIKAGAPQQ
jgi:cytochrome b subunit of formate dehydrogenase